MGLNTYPCSPFPPSTADMEKGDVTEQQKALIATIPGKAQKADIAPEFSAETAYNAGDLVYHNGTLYEFTADHAAGAWSTDDTQAATIDGSLDQLKSGLTNVQSDVKLNTNDLTTPSRTKNLLSMTLNGMKSANTTGTWSGNDYTIYDVTFTVQTDGNGNVVEITASGTASHSMYFTVGTINTKAGIAYTLTGCPSGGSNDNYYLGHIGTSNDRRDFGSGKDFPIDGTDSIYYIQIFVGNGYAANSLSFTPMIRLTADTSATFAPYIPSVESRIEAVENDVNGLRMIPITITDTVQTDSKLSDGVLLSDLTNGIITSSTQVKGLAMFNHRPVIVHWLCYQGKLIFAYDDTGEGGHSYTYKGVLFY